MAIVSAVQQGSVIYAYNEQGSIQTTVPAGDGVVGFTSSTISVRSGPVIYVYNEYGNVVTTVAAPQKT